VNVQGNFMPFLFFSIIMVLKVGTLVALCTTMSPEFHLAYEADVLGKNRVVCPAGIP